MKQMFGLGGTELHLIMWYADYNLIMGNIKEREEKEKDEVIDLLRKQIEIEVKLVDLYKETVSEVKSKIVRNFLHMIQLDSNKHIDICQTVIEVLQGEKTLKPEKKDLMEGLKHHIELEKESIERANQISRNIWIWETPGLKELIDKLKKDEVMHHKSLKKLTEKAFFRLDPYEIGTIFRDIDWLEERYKKEQDYEDKKKKEKI